MVTGCLWFILQTIHIVFSLGGLLVFMNDLRGSIIVDAAGKVANYKDFGGGINGLTDCIFIAFLVLILSGIFNRNHGKKAAIISHLAMVCFLKGAMIWNIYFSGRTDPLIIAAFPLKLGIFVPDIVALIVCFVMIGQLSHSSKNN